MPSDSSDIDNALVAKLLADATLMALTPDGVFVDEASKSMATGGNATRFVIVSLVDEDDEDVFGGTAFEDALFRVEARMLSTVPGANVKAAAARIQTLLHDQPLTVAGYTWMTLHRERRTRLTEVDQQDPSIRWYRRGGEYRLQMALT